MSTVISVYGSSDDLVEFSGEGEFSFPDEKGDRPYAEYNAYDNSKYLVTGSEGDQAFIYATYGDMGCWYFSVGLVEEDTLIPAGWAISIGQSEENTYSAELKIRAMDRLRVEQVKD